MKIYSREEAIRKSVEYFNGDELAAEVFVTKYAMRNDKMEIVECTPEQMHHRLAKEFARIEKKYPNPMSEEEIFNLFDRFKYVVPQGSPMFGIGNIYQKCVSLSNCFVIDVVDSYGGICRADERIAQISKRRGGCGLDISAIRPKGLPTKNSALTTDGIVVFMERFSNTAREVAQQGRRGALLISISVHHPEVLNFIRAKRDLKKVTGANISIRITDEFMKAVQKKDTYEQRWPVDSDKPVIKREVKAKEIWDELIKSNWMSGEPGILFWDTIIKNSPADSYADESLATTSTNPCITGDTLVYVADGRGNVPIKQLATEERDVPVFCYDNNGRVCIRNMIHPRKTGYNQPIYKITLDDGCIIRVTVNHKIMLNGGIYKEAKDLSPGDSLKIITRFESSIKDVFKEKTRSSDYYWIANGFSNNKMEHRIIAGHKEGREIRNGEVIHHIDHNTKNNSIDNLKVMSKKRHDQLHRKNMMGKNNPMVRAKEEWEKYICDKNIPLMSRYREKELGKPVELLKWAAEQCGIKHINEDPRVVKTLYKLLEQGYNAYINNQTVYVEKECEYCHKKFQVIFLQRERCFCSCKCTRRGNSNKEGFVNRNSIGINKFYSDRSVSLKKEQINIFCILKNKMQKVPLRKEWEKECKLNKIPFRFGSKYGFKGYSDLVKNAELYNHRVVSIEIDGHEDVYNGTVEEFHNFFIGGFQGKTFHGKNKWVYINNKNCGELPLSPGSSCILLLQNLTSYVKNPFSKDASLDEDLLVKNTRKAQRLIDDMVDLEIEAIERIIEKVKSDPESDEIKYNELNLWNSIRETCIKSRRTGLGITGLGDYIAMLGEKYSSKESIKIVEKIFKIIRDEAYRSSVQMAKERGSFPIWSHKKEKDNKFLNRLPKDILMEMEKVGRRNISCLTVPPAGSSSTLTQTTSGFDPVFMAEHVRKRKLTESDKDRPDFIDAMGDKWRNYKVIHNGLKIFKQITGKEFEDSPYCGAQSHEVDYTNRVKMQGLATSFVDHAISNTVNAPNSATIEDVEKLYMDAWSEGCKGITFYRDGSRDGVLTKEASKNTTRECDDCDEAGNKLKELVQQGLRPTKIILSPAPKRNPIMSCEIHRSKVGKGDWLFFVGMLNGQPYEVFGGSSNKFTIPNKYKDGWIIKNGKSKSGITQYHLVLGSLEDKDEKMEFKDINKHFNNKEYGAFTRLVSLSMRHGTPIKYICEQITKTGCAGDLFSFQRAMSRVLKKYIADGEKSEAECPICKSSEVIYKNGCPTCKICGHSNCS